MDISIGLEKTSTTFHSDEVFEKYSSLKKQYEIVCRQFEACQQELYESRKNNQIASELKEHLTSELEMWQRNEVKMKQDFNYKYQTLNDEMEQLRHEKWKEVENCNSLIETLQSRIKSMETIENVSAEEKSVCQMDNTKMSEDWRRLEEENVLLKDQLSEQKAALIENLNLAEDLKNHIKVLNEREDSLKINLENKKSELASVTDMLHSAQEDLLLANSELQQIKQQANGHAPKGNSLFAEVDDKRQEMLKSYSQLRDKVQQLNRELMSKQSELDSLLCEKKTLWEEYSGQANHHDAVLNRAFEHRITDLEKENDQLHREIARWYESNLDLNTSTIAQWVSGVLDYYRDENQRLTNDFAASSVDNLNKEQKVRELHRQLVSWRTKAMEANARVSQLNTVQKLNSPVAVKNESVESPETGNVSRVSNTSRKDFAIYESENTLNHGGESEVCNNEASHKPGILVTAGVAKSKTAKKTSFQ
ncbi:spindle apparatus coiled-coil protein 1 spindly [Arctopsyche grandis]|uniref:spindle apparatus coiled-coil protein 1 spindly n=1 Tax=Arctopsyche grandis TaxID=121162 RepID=UPI00406D896E